MVVVGNKMNEPVAIAIVSYKNVDDVHRCLAALTLSVEKNFVVCICENGGELAYNSLLKLRDLIIFDERQLTLVSERISEGRAGQLLSGQPVRIYSAVSNLGYAGGVNAILQQLMLGERWSGIWILNPDTEAHPRALKALLDRSVNGNYSLVGSRLLYSDSGRVQSYGGHWRPLIANGRSLGMNTLGDEIPDIDNVERQTDYVMGASLFATREYVEAVGMMDERYFLYCEEVDWCFRRGRRRLGYAHDSIVYHSQGTTTGSNSNRKKRSKLVVYLDERNRHLITRRFFPKLYPIVALTTLLFTAQYLKAGSLGNFLVALSGWYAGIRGEEGIPKKKINR